MSEEAGSPLAGEHAARGRASASECLTLLDHGLRPDPGRLEKALSHLRIAIRVPIDRSEPDGAATAMALGELLLAAYPTRPDAAREARDALRRALTLLRRGGQVGLPPGATGQLLSGIISAGSVLVTGARHSIDPAEQAEQDRLIDDGLTYLDHPGGAERTRRDSTALVMNLLAERAGDPYRRRPDDPAVLIRMAAARGEHEVLSSDRQFAAETALVVAESLVLQARRGDRSGENALTEAVRLLDDHRELEEVRQLGLEPGYDALFATAVGQSSVDLVGRREEAIRACEHAISLLPSDDPNVELLRQLREALRSRTGDLRDSPISLGAGGMVEALERLARRSAPSSETEASPAGREEIVDTLRRLKIDALVYLIPAGLAGREAVDDLLGVQVPQHGIGSALLLLSNGSAAWVTLPQVERYRMDTVERYARAHAGLLINGGSGPGLAVWREQLDCLIEWAWHCVLEPLAALVIPEIPGLPSRLALVPLGMLGVVPWAAARPSAERGVATQAAVARFIISSTPSGSALVQAARRHRRPLGDYSMLVGPPGDPEIEALVSEAFPYAERLDEPSATPGRLAEALSRQGCSLLYHAGPIRFDRDDPGRSGLGLGPDVLTAERISRLGSGDFGYSVGLSRASSVVLGPREEDVVSLPAAFLAGGASSVLGALWRVDEKASAVTAFVLHHHLAAGVPAAEALQRTQLWMSDRNRKTPSWMPTAIQQLAEGTALDDPVAWAAMVQHGC